MTPSPNNQGIPADHPYRSDAALRQRYDSAPNFALRRTVGLASLGLVAVAGALGYNLAKNAHEQDALNGELAQPFAEVAAKVRSGEISEADVSKFKVGGTEYAWSIASDLTKQDHEGDTMTVSGIIQAQQGDRPVEGSQIIVPDEAIDHPQEP